MLKILFIGDIVGKIGRKTVAQILPKLKRKEKIDLVIANAENSAHGSGITEKIASELTGYGVDLITMGDHTLKQPNTVEVLKKNLSIIRPANFASEIPGNGWVILDIKGKKIAVVNLIGRVFMKSSYECPFKKIDEILANIFAKEKIFAIIIDIHAEASAEKIALFRYLDGRVKALFGTHTHVMTADPQISKKNTAYITDVGMAGFADGCIGVDAENAIRGNITQINYPFSIPEKGNTIFNAMLLVLDEKDAKINLLMPIIKFVNIK